MNKIPSMEVPTMRNVGNWSEEDLQVAKRRFVLMETKIRGEELVRAYRE